MPLIAQQLPAVTSNELMTWFLCLAAFVLIAERLFAFWKNHLRGEPPAQSLKASSDIIAVRVASLETAMHRAEDTLKNAADFDRRIGSLETGRMNDAREASGQRRLLYEKVDNTSRELREHVDGIRKELSEDMGILADKIGNTPAETVALLRNAGVIKP